ncbi:unnamed protein product, partial [Didymodactylos carnosus]
MFNDLIEVNLKFGITYGSTQIKRSDTNAWNDLQDGALEIVQSVLPNFEPTDYRNRLKLFLISHHDVIPNLTLITSHTDLTPACFIEVIIWTLVDSVVLSHEHQLEDHTYKEPTYCRACEYLMWGPGKQCKICKTDYHHECAAHLPPNCSDRETRPRQASAGTLTSTNTYSTVNVPSEDDLKNVSKRQKKRLVQRKLFNFSKSKEPLSNGTHTLIADITNDVQHSEPPAHDQTNSDHLLYNKTLTSGVDPVSIQTRGEEFLVKEYKTREDVKLTNVQEKNGIWRADAQVGREFRHSRQVDVIYDKKKFQFVTKNQDGSKEIVELSADKVKGGKIHEKTKSDSIATLSYQKEAYEKLANLLLDIIDTAAQSVEKDTKIRSSFKVVPSSDNNKDFFDLYDMNEKEILGIGRYGMVFGGTMKKNGVPVAIKRIQISHYNKKDRENIQQEAKYLFELRHPSKICLLLS